MLYFINNIYSLYVFICVYSCIQVPLGLDSVAIYHHKYIPPTLNSIVIIIDIVSCTTDYVS